MTIALPPGKIQFFSAAGKPLAGGLVHHYIPGTTTPKDTFQDAAGTILNTNPVVLDAAGEAVILGNGTYRQVLTDSLGNQLWDQVTVVPDAADKLPLTGGTLTGTLIAPSVGVTGGEGLTVFPTGDAVTTLASFNVQGTTTSTTTREYLAAVSLIANKRNGTGGTVSPSVALYTGVQGQNGTADIWSIKTTITQDAVSGTYNGIGHEITVVNGNAHRGDALGAAGLAAPFTYGMAIDGTATFRSTAALTITGTVGLTPWNRGVVIANNSVTQAAFQDLGTSTISYEIQGTHTYGIDVHLANFGANAINLAAGQVIGVGAVNMMFQSGSNLILGDVTTNIFSRGGIFPSVDNTVAVGQNGFRWASIWAANGTIQTSDPSMKTDIQPIAKDAAAAILAAINPITFKWISGGNTRVTTKQPGMVPVTAPVTFERAKIEIRNGVPVQIMETITEDQQVYDDLPVVDETGAPVMVTTKDIPEARAEDGTLIHAAIPSRTFQATHRVPRMQPGEVEVSSTVETAGKRMHWGWDASQVKTAFDAAGLDFGGYVRAEDGTQHLRPDQLLPVLWRAVQTLAERLKTLETK